MNPFDPFNLFHLSGFGTMHNVTLALPTRRGAARPAGTASSSGLRR